MYETINHTKYFQLVQTKGLMAAYQSYKNDGGVLGTKAFCRKYNV